MKLPARWGTAAAAGLIALAALAAYRNSFAAPFVYDDRLGIVDNPTIRSLAGSLAPPGDGLTVQGRPILNLSLAINYALGGAAPWGYHAVNLAIHLLAGLALFGIVRRTLAGRPEADALALGAALLWTLHPLQTESVTYVIQRAESLMGLFYLLTLYGFIRGAQAGGRPALPWFALSWACCLLGMGTKEVMVTAPVMVFVYDRTFLAGSFREAWRRRRAVHLALAATWIPLALLVAGEGRRGGSAGLGVGPGWWAYAATQFEAIARYLGLSLWPHPQVFEYGSFVASPAAACAGALIVLPLAAGTLYALVKRPAAGFLGLWFFGILAPTSLVPSAVQTMAEHRMYLPLAALAVAAAAAACRAGPRAGLMLCLGAAAALGFATAARNGVYASSLSLWSDTVAKRPGNPVAHNNLGVALFERGRVPEAVAQYREALRLDPSSVYDRLDLADALALQGNLSQAVEEARRAVRLKPGWAGPRYRLAGLLTRARRPAEAVGQYREAMRIRPGDAQFENGLGSALFSEGRVAEAIGHFREAIRLDERYADAYNNLGTALASANRLAEAVAAYRRAIALQPGYVLAHYSLANVLAQANQPAAAIGEFREVLRLQAGTPDVHNHLGILLAETGQLDEAEGEFKQALRLKPDDPEARRNLAELQAYERSRAARP